MLGRLSISVMALAIAGCSSEGSGTGETAADETAAAPAQLLALQSYRQMCDASAAVMLDDTTFVVANDEDNVLRVYRVGTPDPLNAGEDDLSEFLDTDGDEADIEGAARIGSRVYWITSHGANSKGKARPERRRFFATEITANADGATIETVGDAYAGLVDDLAKLPALEPFDLLAKAKIAPEAGGLNIEGLAAAPDGSLLLALRSPLANGAAIVVPLLNPDEIVMGGEPRFGAPLFLDLGMRGVRSIDAAGDGAGYVLSAGAVGDGVFAFFRWRPGETEEADRLKAFDVDPNGLFPEAMSLFPGSTGRWLVLSDDGDVPIDGTACKDSNDKRFRAGEANLGPI